MNTIRAIDPTNEEDFSRWFDVLHRSELLRDEGREEGWRPQEWRVRALDVTGAKYHVLYALGDDDHFVAVGALEVTRDDLEWMRADLFVDPEQRRRGYGTELLDGLEQRARDFGRTALALWVVEGEHEVDRSPSRYFAPARGYARVAENIQRDLAWPRPPGELERLKDGWSARARDYEILAWLHATPDGWRADRAEMFRRMPVEVPDPGVTQKEEVWDDDRVVEHEQRARDTGRELLIAVARSRESNHLVGFSELTLELGHPVAYQWDTLVLRPHRGHRLGGLMKIANFETLRAGDYAVEKIITFNATDNPHMIAVNDALRATVSGRIVVWRKTLAP